MEGRETEERSGLRARGCRYNTRECLKEGVEGFRRWWRKGEREEGSVVSGSARIVNGVMESRFVCLMLLCLSGSCVVCVCLFQRSGLMLNIWFDAVAGS